MDWNTVLRVLCGGFYGLLCLFSLVTGLIYMTGRRELNPVELSDRFVRKLSDPEKRRKFARGMGVITFVVGLAQGLTAYCILRAGKPLFYWIALGFTVFSIGSVGCKLRGKVSAFPLLKLAAYFAILVILLLPATQFRFF